MHCLQIPYPRLEMLEQVCLPVQPTEDVAYTGLSMELQTVVQRIQLLGFNAIKLPFTFSQLFDNSNVTNYTRACDHPSLLEV